MALRRAAIVLIALLAVLSPMAGVVGFAGPADAAPPDFVTVPGENVERSSTTVDPERGPPTDRLPTQAGGPSAQPAVQSPGSGSGGSGPPAHALDRIPDHALDNVLASRHADTLSVQFAPTNSGSVALVVTDDQHSAGREVGIPTDALESALGRQPQVARGVHESGEQWTAPISYEDGHAVFEVPHFSTNTVTFSGTYTIDASPASDGSQFVYDITDMDTVTDFSVNVTGVRNTETETFSATSVSDGHSRSITLGGNEPLSGPQTGNPEVEITGNVIEEGYGIADGEYSSSGEHPGRNGVVFQSSSEANRIDWTFASNSYNVDVTLVDDGSGNDIKSVPASQGSMDVDIESNKNYRLVLEDTSASVRSEFYEYGSPMTTSGSFGYVTGVEEGQKSDGYAMAFSRIDLMNEPRAASISASDGTSWSAGDFTDGETKSAEFDLTKSADQLTLSASAGKYDYTFTATETTVTDSPSIEINGNTTSHSGTLADGNTESLTVNAGWLHEGQNTVTVSAAGTLPSGSPEAQVGLEYEHGYTDDQTTVYESRRWTSNYDIAKTFGATQDQASLSVPFKDTVYAIQSAEMRVNETGGWSILDDADYELVGNDLEVDLDAGYGGDIPAGTTIEVRANASKVGTTDLTMTVLNATDMGSTLDSKIQVESAGSNPSIEVGGTETGDRVHYLYDETWDASESSVFDGAGQELRLPNAAAGETARVTHLPTAVSPDSGDVEIEVTETGAEPTLDVRPGPDGANTEVTFTHHQTVSGAEYLLYSATNGIVHDSATAQSPVTLVDDDSEETLEITRDDGSGSTDSDGGGGGIPGQVVGQFTEDNGAPNWPLIIAALAIALGLLAVVQVRTGRSPITAAAGGIRDAGSLLAERPRALAVLLVVGFGGSIFLGIVQVPESVFVVLVVAAVAVLSYVGLQRMDRFSMPVYGLVVAVSAFAALTATGQLSAIFDALGTSGSAILVMGLVFLAWRALKASGQPDEVVNFDLGRGSN